MGSARLPRATGQPPGRSPRESGPTISSAPSANRLAGGLTGAVRRAAIVLDEKFVMSAPGKSAKRQLGGIAHALRDNGSLAGSRKRQHQRDLHGPGSERHTADGRALPGNGGRSPACRRCPSGPRARYRPWPRMGHRPGRAAASCPIRRSRRGEAAARRRRSSQPAPGTHGVARPGRSHARHFQLSLAARRPDLARAASSSNGVMLAFKSKHCFLPASMPGLRA